MAFHELRQYTIRPGKMEEWVTFMEGEIIPYIISKGMTVVASFRGEEDQSVYFWIRRFESEESREELYKAVYESDHWKDTLSPKVGMLIDREAINIQRVVATPASPLQ